MNLLFFVSLSKWLMDDAVSTWWNWNNWPQNLLSVYLQVGISQNKNLHRIWKAGVNPYQSSILSSTDPAERPQTRAQHLLRTHKGDSCREQCLPCVPKAGHSLRWSGWLLAHFLSLPLPFWPSLCQFLPSYVRSNRQNKSLVTDTVTLAPCLWSSHPFTPRVRVDSLNESKGWCGLSALHAGGKRGTVLQANDLLQG